MNLSSRGLGVSGSAAGFTYRKQLISKRDLERAAHEQAEQPIHQTEPQPGDFVDASESAPQRELALLQRISALVWIIRLAVIAAVLLTSLTVLWGFCTFIGVELIALWVRLQVILRGSEPDVQLWRGAWSAVAGGVLLLASFPLATTRETRAPHAPTTVATPTLAPPALPPESTTEPSPVAPARAAQLNRAPASKTLCGSAEAIDVVRKLSRWGDYSCKTRNQARDLWSDCLDRSMYSLIATGGCPGKQKCCPPSTQPSR